MSYEVAKFMILNGSLPAGTVNNSNLTATTNSKRLELCHT